MRTKLVFSVLALTTVLAVAQTKVSGTIECGKADKQNTIEIAANRSYNISQSKCTWTKPLDFGGAKTKETVYTAFMENTGERSREHGVSLETLSNGDSMEVHTQATGTASKDGKVTSDGKWSISRVTGKTKGMKGSGTYKCSGTADKLSCEVEGEYTAAAAPEPKAKKK
jgi:hypothetical protein